MATFERRVLAGSILGGELYIEPERGYGEYDDCEVSILVERKRKSRSKDQLAYYWGVVLPEIATHTGHDVDELHEIFKSKYLRKKRFWRETTLTTISSTSALTLKEMSNFIKLVISEANEMEIEVPPPPSEKSYSQ